MKSIDERASELAKSGFAGDIRIPLDIAARLKSTRLSKSGDIDGDKIDAQKKSDEEDGGDGEDKKSPKTKPETEDEIDTAATPGAEESKGGDYEKSFRTVDGGTLHRARLRKLAHRADPMFVKIGQWVSESLKKSDIGTLRKAIAAALPEYQKQPKGKTVVAGLKEPGKVSEGDNDPKILKINTEIMCLQKEMQEKGSDPFDNSVIFNKLREAYENLAEAIMDSCGLGMQTEDIIACDPEHEPPAAMVSHLRKSDEKSKPVVIPENTTGKNVIVTL